MAGTHQSNYFKWKKQGGVEVGWQDRTATYPSRRQLTHVSGTAGSVEVVEVSRAPEDVRVAGDAFSATNMNDLEERIDTAMGQMESVFQDGVDTIATAIRNNGGTVPSPSTPANCATAITNLANTKYKAGFHAVVSSQYYYDLKSNVAAAFAQGVNPSQYFTLFEQQVESY